MWAPPKISRPLFIIFTFRHTILPDDVNVGQAMKKNTHDISIEAFLINQQNVVSLLQTHINDRAMVHFGYYLVPVR